ncbi:DNA polymerase III subunit delta [Planktosalinus lacus]|uniref:DNA polymerase III subunit delta n=1 Tax=Planktosalinus lacus TaxID=1526573 RepID=A0A8J2Y9G2_9FLAO|nr:DNA polymerase III subunit delta [Planktosalinus lacus]GGD91967.1 DNA polymerase III subunit delta [Planktosalinus lacus]
MEEVKRIVNNIKNGNIQPVYLLTGDEPYFIDFVSDYIEKNVLTEDEKAFNQTVLYGRDVTVDDIVSNAKRYPMMAERQVIIVKEAQELSRTIENLAPYCTNPQPTTVLVICYKYKKIDKRKALYKAIKKNGGIVEEKKLYENQVGNWITKLLSSKGYSISIKASLMLVEFLGNDLGRISNEIDKLTQIVKPEQQITPEIIELNIGISKDFNNFELQNAIGNKDIQKAFQIINYFAQNPKDNPLVMTVALLYSYFSKVLKYHALASKNNASKEMGINPYFVKDYQLAAKNYPMKKVSAILAKLRDTDMKSKGVGAANVSDGDLLKELLTVIFA